MAFTPGHRSPAGGLPAWEVPDPARQPVATIGAGLDVQLVEQRPDGWAKVVCSNGWSAWVDGRRLAPTAVAAARPPAPAPARSMAPASPAAAAAVNQPVQLGGVRVTTPLIGGALLVVACLLPWLSDVSKNAFGVPVKLLFDPNIQSSAGFKLGFVLIVLGGVTVAAGLGRLPAQAGRFAGGASAVLATLFVAQAQRALGQVQAATVFGVLGIGVYLTMLGGVLAAMSRAGSAKP